MRRVRSITGRSCTKGDVLVMEWFLRLIRPTLRVWIRVITGVRTFSWVITDVTHMRSNPHVQRDFLYRYTLYRLDSHLSLLFRSISGWAPGNNAYCDEVEMERGRSNNREDA